MAELDATPAAEPEDARKPRRRFRFPVKSAIALAVIVVLGLPAFSTLQPGYYGRYPGLAERMENWRESTHARIPCSGCHVDPGVAGFVGFAARSIPDFYSQLIRGPHETNLLGVPGRRACQKCHTSYRQVSSNGDLLIPHRAHVEVLQINCADCHKDLVHSGNEHGYNKPSMAACLKACHDGTKATSECVKCHTRKQVPDNHLQEDWLEVHSAMTSKIDCGACHAWSPDYCNECHSKRPKSHAGNWKKLHQVPAKARGVKGCYACHEGGTSCKECHD